MYRKLILYISTVSAVAQVTTQPILGMDALIARAHQKINTQKTEIYRHRHIIGGMVCETALNYITMNALNGRSSWFSSLFNPRTLISLVILANIQEYLYDKAQEAEQLDPKINTMEKIKFAGFGLYSAAMGLSNLRAHRYLKSGLCFLCSGLNSLNAYAIHQRQNNPQPPPADPAE